MNFQPPTKEEKEAELAGATAGLQLKKWSDNPYNETTQPALYAAWRSGYGREYKRLNDTW
jgi:hypothetical protein